MSALNCAGHESEIWIHVLVTLCHAHKFYYLRWLRGLINKLKLENWHEIPTAFENDRRAAEAVDQGHGRLDAKAGRA